MITDKNKSIRGYFGIGIYQPSNEYNQASLFRSAFCFNADYLFSIGRKYKKGPMDTVDATKHVPYHFFESFREFKENRPRHSKLVAVELTDNARDLCTFVHPEQAVYILGNESYGIHDKVINECDLVVKVPRTTHCLNVAVTGAIVIYDRISKQINR